MERTLSSRASSLFFLDPPQLLQCTLGLTTVGTSDDGVDDDPTCDIHGAGLDDWSHGHDLFLKRILRFETLVDCVRICFFLYQSGFKKTTLKREKGK